MPFDLREAPGRPPDLLAVPRRGHRAVALWLFVVAGMILVMIVLGGATRLTGSGLSIMEWAPFSGALPPLNAADWQRLFGLYKQIPQFALVNAGFGLDGFKHIFWLEYFHRLWGRLIGLAFFVPLIAFWPRAASSGDCARACCCCSCSAACRARSAGSWSPRVSSPTPPPFRPPGW